MAQRSVPAIDLSAHLAGAPAGREAAAREVEDALAHVGFFSIVGHGIDWAQVERDQWGIDPHWDAGCMTLLPTNPVDGLQIRPGRSTAAPATATPSPSSSTRG